MNCVNCGATPRANHSSCLYCESLLDQRVMEADMDRFTLMLHTLRVTAADPFKADIVTQFRKKFTAGQVRQILATFVADSFKMDAAEHLVPRTTNPSGLLACADLFISDSFRCDFVELLNNDEEEEDFGRAEDFTTSRSVPHSVTASAPSSYIGRALVLLLIILLGLNPVWMISYS